MSKGKGRNKQKQRARRILAKSKRTAICDINDDNAFFLIENSIKRRKGFTIYLSSVEGSDKNDGKSIDTPKRTLHGAISTLMDLRNPPNLLTRIWRWLTSRR